MFSTPEETALPSPLTSPDRKSTINIIRTTMISTRRYFFQLYFNSFHANFIFTPCARPLRHPREKRPNGLLPHRNLGAASFICLSYRLTAG